MPVPIALAPATRRISFGDVGAECAAVGAVAAVPVPGVAVPGVPVPGVGSGEPRAVSVMESPLMGAGIRAARGDSLREHSVSTRTFSLWDGRATRARRRTGT